MVREAEVHENDAKPEGYVARGVEERCKVGSGSQEREQYEEEENRLQLVMKLIRKNS